MRATWQDFSNNEQGATAIFFAIILIPLVAFVGVALDASRAYTAKEQLQSALDSAAVAGGRAFLSAAAGSTEAQRATIAEQAANRFFAANFPDGFMGMVGRPNVQVVQNDQDKIELQASMNIPTTFMAALGMDNIAIAATAELTRDYSALEVIMVVDNTGSMFDDTTYRSMYRLKEGMRGVTNTLYDWSLESGVVIPGGVRIGIIPYALAVNANVEQIQPDNPNAGTLAAAPPPLRTPTQWLDYLMDACVGQRTNECTTRTQTAYANLAALQSDFAPVNVWRGCLQTHPQDWQISNSATPGANDYSDRIPSPFRFWPFLHPRSGATGCTNNNSSSMTNPYLPPGGSCTPCAQDHYDLRAGIWSGSGAQPFCNWTGSNATTQRNLALANPDPRQQTYGTRASGPNLGCGFSAMLPLSGNRPQIMRKINEMQPGNYYGTHTDLGLQWAIRMLSPRSEWKNFFGTPASVPVEWNHSRTRKIVILVTEGQNDQPGMSAHLPRLGNSTATPRLNRMMNAACAALHNYGVEVYVVLMYDIHSPSNLEVERNCPTDPTYYFPVWTGNLDQGLVRVAADIVNLRLSR